MDPAGPLGLSTEALYWLSIYTLVLGALIIVLIIVFALALLYARRWWWRKSPYAPEKMLHELHHLLMGGSRRDALTAGSLIGSAYAEHLARRNEFWMTYGQLTVAILLLVVVTILLLTRTIEPDAGLPILSGIAGFAIAKGTDSPRGGFKPPEGEQ